MSNNNFHMRDIYGHPTPYAYPVLCAVCERETGETSADPEAEAPDLCYRCEDDEGYHLNEFGGLYQDAWRAPCGSVWPTPQDRENCC